MRSVERNDWPMSTDQQNIEHHIFIKNLKSSIKYTRYSKKYTSYFFLYIQHLIQYIQCKTNMAHLNSTNIYILFDNNDERSPSSIKKNITSSHGYDWPVEIYIEDQDFSLNIQNGIETWQDLKKLFCYKTKRHGIRRWSSIFRFLIDFHC